MLVRATGKVLTKTTYMGFKDGFLVTMNPEEGVIHLKAIIQEVEAIIQEVEAIIQEVEVIIPGVEVVLAAAESRVVEIILPLEVHHLQDLHTRILLLQVLRIQAHRPLGSTIRS